MPAHCGERKSQATRILALLIRASGGWVPLPEVMACAAQYNTRIFELRRMGFPIENKTETAENGARRSWFRLAQPNESTAPAGSDSANAPAPEPAADAGDWFTQATGNQRPAQTDETLRLLFDQGRRQ